MQPWVTGPAEILEHALELLESDSDRNRRLAMIAIDNAVELAIKTYLGLPKRVTGINLPRQKFQEISESFPRILDDLEKQCGDKLDGVDLGELEWYHRLRNQLYHQGNGLTVEREKVRVYAELAKILFRNLFGAEIQISHAVPKDALGLFLSGWVRVEKMVTRLGSKYRHDLTTTGGRMPPAMTIMPALHKLGVISRKDLARLDRLRTLRNAVIHGESEPEKVLDDRVLKDLEEVSAILSKALTEKKDSGQ